MYAIILSAGQGTRLRPLTDEIPKTLVEVKSRPILEWIFDLLPESVDKVIIVRGYKGEMIEKKFGARYNNRPIRYLDQLKLNGTADALWEVMSVLEKSDQQFLVLHGDNIYDQADLERLITTNNLAMGVNRQIRKTAKIIFDASPDGRLLGSHLPTENELDQPILICTGAYLLDRRIFKVDPVSIDNGELGLPQTVIEFAQTTPVQLIEMPHWTEINTLDDLSRANHLYSPI